MCANREMRSRGFILAHRFLGEAGRARPSRWGLQHFPLRFGERREIPPCGRDDKTSFHFLIELQREIDGALKCAATNSKTPAGWLRLCLGLKLRCGGRVALCPGFQPCHPQGFLAGVTPGSGLPCLAGQAARCSGRDSLCRCVTTTFHCA